jgi:hypothetical protein
MKFWGKILVKTPNDKMKIQCYTAAKLKLHKRTQGDTGWE